MSKSRPYLLVKKIGARLTSLLQSIKLPGLDGLTLYDLFVIYAEGITKGSIRTRASAISYSFFMAIFPFILFILNLIPFISIENFQSKFLSFMNRALPVQAATTFEQIFKEIALQQNQGLLTVAFLSSLFLMANGINAIYNGFGRSVHADFTRKQFRQYILSMAVSVMLVLFLLIGVILSLYIEYFLTELKANNIMTANSESSSLGIVRNITFIFMLVIFVATLYYTAMVKRRGHFISVGAVFSTVLILLSSYGYGIYINNFATYNEVYGSLGALLIFMVYIWVIANILLLGYELNMAIRKLRARNLVNS